MTNYELHLAEEKTQYVDLLQNMKIAPKRIFRRSPTTKEPADVVPTRLIADFHSTEGRKQEHTHLDGQP